MKLFSFRPNYDWGNLEGNKKVDYFDLETEHWETVEADFPLTPTGGSTNVQYGRDFLSFGGFTNSNPTDTIYRVQGKFFVNTFPSY